VELIFPLPKVSILFTGIYQCDAMSPTFFQHENRFAGSDDFLYFISFFAGLYQFLKFPGLIFLIPPVFAKNPFH
jgi:hypothetical protein